MASGRPSGRSRRSRSKRTAASSSPVCGTLRSEIYRCRGAGRASTSSPTPTATATSAERFSRTSHSKTWSSPSRSGGPFGWVRIYRHHTTHHTPHHTTPHHRPHTTPHPPTHDPHSYRSLHLSNELHPNTPTNPTVKIGPQQQHEPSSDLGERCSLVYPIRDQCPTQGCADFRNITLRNIQIVDPWLSPGVILGNVTNPMSGILFDNVTVTKSGHLPLLPYGDAYHCENAQIEAINSDPGLDCSVGLPS
mmetsp:Transcript_69204/g.193537  ORF Transcript_69204/g.193537 Transcript_69204/m.193537 type:complete len:249 (+) Transcript_69204:304-1050(+)